ncbi:Probable transposase [Laribacter hongkongensis HLHK9]|uniref:Probable transposase n=1 Tax=Laribacter hongkongensis (strain HLHK9) TaxID=557598 RepID=C1D942_LARHH|nr:transposase [Laribacter hongkongensis]ACO74982.1 Probable transposase [Laribacter hongkongensis HLHK9]
MHLLVDSTGLKICGEGEWKVKKHGAEYQQPMACKTIKNENIISGFTHRQTKYAPSKVHVSR